MGQQASVPKPGTQLQVIGAGLSRTGTASFSAALEILLDGPIYHGGTQNTMGRPVEIKSWIQILRTWLAGDRATTLSLLQRRTTGYAAITDAPASQLVPELLALYPDSKVIVTVRDPDAWVKSMQQISSLAKLWFLGAVLLPLPGNAQWDTIYDGSRVNAYIYERHLEWLKEVVPADQLVFFSVKDGWGPLCEALGKEVPTDIPFPRVNDSKAIDRVAEYHIKRGLAQRLDSTEPYRLTEINARFSFNGFMHQAYGQEVMSDLGAGSNGLIHTTDSSKILNGLLSLFNPSRLLHLFRGEEPGIDIHMFIDFVHRHIGIRPRLVTPVDLRLIPDPKSPDGGKLCCLVKDQGHARLINESPVLLTSNGEVVEEIHQVGLELHQHELFGLSPEILREVCLRCFNDMRIILLVHDKRMLGIIKQEIPSLVAREVLTPAQGEALDAGIADSFIPGSPELNELIQTSAKSPELRKEYSLKPIRGGKGAGILFGDEVGADEWLSTLKRPRNPQFVSGNTMYVVQRRLWPRLYEVILKSSGDRGHYPLIGTYHTTNGQLLGLGTWRSSPDRICAVSHGGAWIWSVLDEYLES
ncbi:hypothetical protein APSETT445_003766 [Aspergillus pseudonomiae]